MTDELHSIIEDCQKLLAAHLEPRGPDAKIPSRRCWKSWTVPERAPFKGSARRSGKVHWLSSVGVPTDGKHEDSPSSIP